MAKVVIEVIKGNKGCIHGHKKGDIIEYEGTNIKGNICASALHGIFHIIYALKMGADLSYANSEGKVKCSCNDYDNAIVFNVWRED